MHTRLFANLGVVFVRFSKVKSFCCLFSSNNLFFTCQRCEAEAALAKLTAEVNILFFIALKPPCLSSTSICAAFVWAPWPVYAGALGANKQEETGQPPSEGRC